MRVGIGGCDHTIFEERGSKCGITDRKVGSGTCAVVVGSILILGRGEEMDGATNVYRPAPQTGLTMNSTFFVRALQTPAVVSAQLQASKSQNHLLFPLFFLIVALVRFQLACFSHWSPSAETRPHLITRTTCVIMPNTPSNARRVFELRLAQSALSPHDRTAAPTPLADLRTLDDLVWTKEAVCVAALVLGFQDYYCEDLEAFEKRVQTSLGESGGCKSFQDVWHNIKGVTEHWGADWWTVLQRHQIRIQQVPSFNLAVYLNKYSKAAQPLSDVVAELQAFDKVRRQDIISVQRRYDPRNPTHFGQTVRI